MNIYFLDVSWLVHESPGLKPDWLGDIKLFSVKNSYILLYNILSNIFQQQEAKILDGSFSSSFPFLCAGIKLAFFYSVGNFFIFKL